MTIKLPRLILALYLLIVFFIPVLWARADEQKPPQIPLSLPSFSLPKLATISAVIAPPHYTKDQIQNHLQADRNRLGLSPLTTDATVCQTGEAIFKSSLAGNTLEAQDLNPFCPQCVQKAFLTIEGNYFTSDQAPWMAEDEVIKLITQNFSHLCVYQENDKALLLLGTIKATRHEVSNQSQSTLTTINFTESQLWQALVDYRHAHTKKDLLSVDSLCQYARERVAEHINLYATKPKADYQNQDKYPLDAHAGFERDGASGYLFEKTGFNVVAENLAFWPTATSPNQVIEWGWDTSTEGHREAQLSDEYTHACLSGGNGFYVAIFARN